MRKKTGIYLFYLLLFVIELLSFRIASTDTSFWGAILTSLIIVFNSIVIGTVLLKNRNNDDRLFYIIIFISHLIRVVFLYLDIMGYTGGFTGADTERFYKYASTDVATSVNYINFLKVFFKIFGISRLVAQYFNVLLTLFSFIILYRIMVLLKIPKKVSLISLCIICFSPANILLSVTLLREPLMIFLNSISLYLFLKWYKYGNIIDFIISAACVLISSWLHSGMIGAIVLYCFAFPFYSRKTNRIIIKKNSLFLIFLVFGAMMLFFFYFGSSVLSYFDRINDISDITARTSIGSTDYLYFLNNVTSLPILLLFLPLKIFYFYFSPMPWDCHTISVACVFLFSSTIYIYLIFNIFKNSTNNKTLKKMLLILFFSLSIIYSLGVSNAGTAMRHREKILPYLLVLYVVSDLKNRKRDDLNENNV